MSDRIGKFKSALLWLPARLYELAVRLRVVAYETDYLRSKRLGATVISVGNLTHGGTGKTPMVAYIARYLRDEGHRVAILTRGYGRKSKGRRVLNEPRGAAQAAPGPAHEEFGDEPLMLARALPDVPVVIDASRFEGGRWAERQAGAEVMILDDGFQHLGLARDLNLLLIDATDPFGGFRMAPFGRLREPLYGLKRADAIIVTRADKPFDQAQLLSVIELFCGKQVPIFYVYASIAELRHLETNEVYAASLFASWNAAVLCAVGNPHAFADDLLGIGVNIVSEHFFEDHHGFTQEELDRVTRKAREAGADLIVTTEKDAVRLAGLRVGEVPVYAARQEIHSEEEVRLKSLLLRAVVGKR